VVGEGFDLMELPVFAPDDGQRRGCIIARLSVDALPVGLDAPDCSLSSQDGFLFLSKPLNFLLDSGQLLLLYCCFIYLGFFIPVMDLDLIKLCVSLSHVYWRRCSRGD
jgi:hypothetical protein